MIIAPSNRRVELRAPFPPAIGPKTGRRDDNRDDCVGAFDVTLDQAHGTNNTTGLQVITIDAGGPFAPLPAPATLAVSVALTNTRPLYQG